MSNDKMKGFKGEVKLDEKTGKSIPAQSEEAIAEAEMLAPDPSAIVPKGDEANPVSGPKHSEATKVLYEKSRRNRDLVTRGDADGSPDVARVRALQAEAAGGEEPENGIDTNANMDEYERKELARMMAEEAAGTPAPAGEKEGEPGSTKQIADEELPDPEEQRMISVKILGKDYEVPQQDIDDAGGVAAYQKNRAATIKLQRAATAEQAALKSKQEAEELLARGQQKDDPSKDGLSKADIKALRAEMMDTVIDGSEEDIDAWIENKILARAASAAEASKDPQTPESSAKPAKVKTETQAELERQIEEDRVEANTMMREEYTDIMSDPELISLAQQRFNVIKANPDNEGRSYKELAREAADHVRQLGRRLMQGERPNPVERERQTRIDRKRTLPQSSRADATAPSSEPETKSNNVPTRREHLQRLRQRAGLG